MQVDIDEIGVEKIRGAEFFVGVSLFDQSQIYFAPLGEKRGLEQQWMVLDEPLGYRDRYITVFTTEEMKLLCRSLREDDGSPVRAFEGMGYRFLVRSGKLRMKVINGCTGCRRFWGDDCPEAQCRFCHRCCDCCGKTSVPYSCASHYIKEEIRKRHVRRRKQSVGRIISADVRDDSYRV